MRKEQKPCPGPGHAPGETCGRPVVSNDLCHNHSRHYREGGYSMEALRPLLGAHGRKFGPSSVRLEIRNVDKSTLKTLKALGKQLPRGDEREKNPVNRAARHLASALAAGQVAFLASWNPEAGPVSAPSRAYGSTPTGRVDLRHVPEVERKALEALGAKVVSSSERRRNLPLRGVRYLIHAYVHGGVKLLGDYAP